MTIAFNLPLAGRVKVEIYALSGSLLGQIQADLAAGNQTILVDLSAYAGGVYAYRLTEDLPSGITVLPLQTFMIARP